MKQVARSQNRVLSASPVRRNEGLANQAAEGIKGEQEAEAHGRGRIGQPDPEGSRGGKLVSPARIRQMVCHVRQATVSLSAEPRETLVQPRNTQRYEVTRTLIGRSRIS